MEKPESSMTTREIKEHLAHGDIDAAAMVGPADLETDLDAKPIRPSESDTSQSSTS